MLQTKLIVMFINDWTGLQTVQADWFPELSEIRYTDCKDGHFTVWFHIFAFLKKMLMLTIVQSRKGSRVNGVQFWQNFCESVTRKIMLILLWARLNDTFDKFVNNL